MVGRMPLYRVWGVLLSALFTVAFVACGSDDSAPTTDETNITGNPEQPRKGGLPPSENGDAPGSSPSAPAKGADPLPTTPPGEWTWLGPEQFDNAVKCMDGSTTGLVVNRSPTGSKKVVLYMRGAAACWDGQSCTINEDLLAADHLTKEEAMDWLKDAGQWSIFNRVAEKNPFKDYNFVWIPYCSGDVFAGDNDNGYKGRAHHGYKNVAAYLPRLAATFADATDVVLTGMSAGGYGASYNFPQVQRAFSKVKVTMISDSAPIFGNTYTPPCLAQKWNDTWGMDKTIPLEGTFTIGFDRVSGAPGNGLYDLMQAMLEKYPENKFALITSRGDLTMRYFHGIGHSANCGLPYILSAGFFEDGLREIRSVTAPNFSTYYGPGTSHVYFYDDAPIYETVVDGITLVDWIAKVVTTKDEPRRVPAQF